MSMGNQPSGMDAFWSNTVWFVVMLLLSFCCAIVPLILGIVGIAVCANPVAKRNAMIVTIVAVISMIIGITYNFAVGPIWQR